MKNIFSFLLALMATTAMAQESLTYAYATKDSQVSPVGTGRVDVYDVAIAINNPSVYDMEITSIEFPIFPESEIEEVTAWISNKLKLEQNGSVKVNVPDIVFDEYEVSYEEGDAVAWLKFSLAEPYLIPDGGLYVGYTFAIDKVTGQNATKYPIAAAQGATDGSLFLHTSRTYKSWADRSADLGATALIQVELQGTAVPPNAARLGAIPKKYVAVDQENTVGVMVFNIGTEPIRTIDYTASTDNGKTITESKRLDTPIEPVFGTGTEVEFLLPEFTEEGTHEVEISVSALNGEAYSISTKGKVSVALFVPKHNAVVEEYTGMWCGNCPRGYVAMEYMSEHYADFIGIAYHNNDPLEMETGSPGLVDGFPMVTLDRKASYDPYFSIPLSNVFTLPDVWESYCSEFAPVEVEVEAKWNEETQTVEATSTLNWALVPDDALTANYRVEYVLVADGLSNPGWYQTNYYADGANGYPEYMDEFTSGPKTVFGLTYNDTAILTSGFKGVKESIPSIAVGEKTSHTYCFDTMQAYNSSGSLIPFDENKLRVVALVLKDAGMGRIVNAAKCDVAVNGEVGIEQVGSATEVVGVEFYDLSGRRLLRPQSGLAIKRVRLSNGQTKAQTVVVY